MSPVTPGLDVRSFCNRDAVAVARDLLGCTLEVDGAGGIIVETEAYSADDPASHSFRGPGKANAAMFGEPGTSYVYRIYGLHHCLNVVCAGASAVLLRALEPETGIDIMMKRRGHLPVDRLCRGPGNLCAALDVDLRLNGLFLDRHPFALSGQGSLDMKVLTGPRIGISRNIDVPWRFGLAGSSSLSKGFAGSRRVPMKEGASNDHA